MSSIYLLREYGVVHLSGALSLAEQRNLYATIKANLRTPGKASGMAEFHCSSGVPGSATRNEPLHDLGKKLYRRCAAALSQEVSETELRAEPALTLLGSIASGDKAPNVTYVAGKSYLAYASLLNHTDCPKSLYTMSVQLGDACDFSVGKRTHRPHANERHGAPATIRMESGDAVFFDGGLIPHAVDRVHKDSAPGWWAEARRESGCDRLVLLFREPLGK